MATPSASEFTPKYTFACYWHLIYSQEEVKHVGSCTVGERGDAYAAAFASQVCRKPKYVKVSVEALMCGYRTRWMYYLQDASTYSLRLLYPAHFSLAALGQCQIDIRRTTQESIINHCPA